MFKDIKYRWALIVFLLIASAYLIWPTYKIYSLTEDEKTELGVSVMKELKEGAINLGLDLQGGMYVLLETDIPKLVEKLAAKSPIELQDAIQEADKRSINNQTDFFNEFLILANDRNLRLVRFYTNLATRRDNESVIDEWIYITADEAKHWCNKVAKNGLFIGQSSGSYLAACIKLMEKLDSGKIVTIFNDFGDRYFSAGLWS